MDVENVVRKSGLEMVMSNSTWNLPSFQDLGTKLVALSAFSTQLKDLRRKDNEKKKMNIRVWLYIAKFHQSNQSLSK